jgi:hypothetical protein
MAKLQMYLTPAPLHRSCRESATTHAPALPHSAHGHYRCRATEADVDAMVDLVHQHRADALVLDTWKINAITRGICGFFVVGETIHSMPAAFLFNRHAAPW